MGIIHPRWYRPTPLAHGLYTDSVGNDDTHFTWRSCIRIRSSANCLCCRYCLIKKLLPSHQVLYYYIRDVRQFIHRLWFPFPHKLLIEFISDLEDAYTIRRNWSNYEYAMLNIAFCPAVEVNSTGTSTYIHTMTQTCNLIQKHVRDKALVIWQVFQ